MPLQQGQTQVGGVTMGTNTPNPVDSVTAGMQTGADWAMKNYQVQTQMQMVQQQAQQLQLENMKTRYAIGTTLYDRMQRIARLPQGNAKNSEIDLLGQDMNGLGMEMHPSAVALMKDKELSKGLGTVLNGMTVQPGEMNPETGKPYSAQEAAQARVQAISSLPNFLSSDKVLDIYQEAQKTRAAMRLKQAEFNQQGALEQYKQGQENSRQDAKLKQDAQIFGIKNAGEVRKEAIDVSKGYNELNQAATIIYREGQKGRGGSDDAIVTQFNKIMGNPSLRSFESQMYTDSASLLDKLKGKYQNWIKGSHLGPQQRQQLVQLTKEIHDIAKVQVRDQLTPHYNSIQAQDPSGDLAGRTFSPSTLGLLRTPSDQMPALPQAPAPGAMPNYKQQRPKGQAAPATPGGTPAVPGVAAGTRAGMNAPQVFGGAQLQAINGMIAAGASPPKITQKIQEWGWKLSQNQLNQINKMWLDRRQAQQSQPGASPSPGAGGQ